MGTSVFVAHAKEDVRRAAALQGALAQAGVQCRRPSPAIRPDADWDESLATELTAADTVVILLTPAAVRSRFLIRQVQHAAEAGKELLPVMVEGAELPDELVSLLEAALVVDCIGRQLDEAVAQITEHLVSVEPSSFQAHDDIIYAVSLTADAAIAATASRERTVRVWDLAAQQCLNVFEGHSYPVKDVVLTPDGSRALSGSVDTTARLWDVASGRCIRVLEGHTGWVEGVATTADAGVAVLASSDETLTVWDLRTGQLQRRMEGTDAPIAAVSLSCDGRLAVSGDGCGVVRLWDTTTGECLRILDGHADNVQDVEVTPDGKVAVSASSDCTLRIWSLRTGQCLRVLEAHEDEVLAVAMDASGSRAVSGGADGTVRSWDLATAETMVVMDTGGTPISCIAIATHGHLCVAGDRRGVIRAQPLARVAGKRSALPDAADPGSEQPRSELGAGEDRPHVFVSYSRRDQQLVLDMVRELRARDLNVWIDQDSIIASMDYRKQITAAIRSCAAVLYMVTANSAASPHVTKEVLWALKQGRPVIPIFLEPAELPDEIGFEIDGLHRLEFHQGPLQENLDRLFRDLRAMREATEGPC